MPLTLGTNNEMTTEGLRRKMLLRQMTGISPTGLRGSTRLPLSPQSGSHSGGSASVPGSPLGSPMRPVTAYFDGRQTVPVKRRLQSAGRTRRTNFPTGVATPGTAKFTHLQISRHSSLIEMFLALCTFRPVTASWFGVGPRYI